MTKFSALLVLTATTCAIAEGRLNLWCGLAAPRRCLTRPCSPCTHASIDPDPNPMPVVRLFAWLQAWPCRNCREGHGWESVGRRPCRKRCVSKINDFFDRWLAHDASRSRGVHGEGGVIGSIRMIAGVEPHRRTMPHKVPHRFACPGCRYRWTFNTREQARTMRAGHVARRHPELASELRAAVSHGR